MDKKQGVEKVHITLSFLRERSDVKIRIYGESPGYPVVRTQHFHCQGSGLIRGWETKIPRLPSVTKKKRHMYMNVCGCVLSRVWLFATPWPSSSVHGVLQARILEWVAISSSRASSPFRDRTCICYVTSLAGGFFTTSATWEAHPDEYSQVKTLINGRMSLKILFLMVAYKLKRKQDERGKDRS